VGAAVVAIATRAGLAARRDSVRIVHGLGATDGYISRRFAGRATLLALAGGVIGAVLAAPMVAGLAALAVPLLAGAAGPPPAALADWAGMVPPSLWLGLAGLPLAAAGIGFATAWLSVRAWLRGLA
jgi:cell division transport system permease protein